MKTTAILLAAVIAVTGVMTGCTSRNKKASSSSSVPESSLAASSSPYLDGVYEAIFKEPAGDRTIDSMAVNVTDGKFNITSYTCQEEPGYDQQSASTEVTGAEIDVRDELNQILGSYEKAGGIINDMEPIEAQSLEHFYRFQRMMRVIVSASERGRTGKIYIDNYDDGAYEIMSKTANSDGYTPFIKATVDKGQISAVTFDAKKGGTVLSASAAEEDQAKITYYKAIADSFQTSGGIGGVTPGENDEGEYDTFVKLAKHLTAAMISGGTKTVIAPAFIDGTYKAQFKDFDAEGWKDVVVLVIQKDVVTVKSFDAISKADQNVLRSSQTELDAKMKAATGTYTYKEAVDMLAQGFSKAENDVFAVDNVTGATVTSNNFKQLVNAILTTVAVNGQVNEVLEIDRVDSQQAE